MTTHVARNKSNLLVLRHLLSLEQEEEVLLHEPVVKLAAVSIIVVRLRDVYNVVGGSFSISGVARGSVVSRGSTYLGGV